MLSSLQRGRFCAVAGLDPNRNPKAEMTGGERIVKEILIRLGGKENMLIAAVAEVFDALRYGIILHPDDVVAQMPAGIAEGKRQHPRNADHVLERCHRAGFSGF